MNSYKPYAGVGNPDTPYGILTQMTQLAGRLEDMGYTLRSSGGQGGDEAFSKGTTNKEIYIPWKKFNGYPDKPFCEITEDAKLIVKPFSPAFDTLKPAVQLIIASKAHLILGPDLQSPVKFLVCWTPDGADKSGNCTAKTGFGGTAIKVAASLSIPIFNLKNADSMQELNKFISI